MSDTQTAEKPVFRTGASVASILASNEVAANTPPPPTQPVVETPVTPTITPTNDTPVTPETPVETPVVETPIPEKNTSSISFDAYEDKPLTPSEPTPTIPPPSVNWKEEIKKNPTEALKELGLDPFAIELSEHIKNGGDATDYLQAKFVDYNKISDESLLKEDLKRQYPNLIASQIDLMYNRRYAPLTDSEEDTEFANTQLQADAYKVRQSKIEQQQKFKIPAAITQTINSDQSQIQAQQLQELELERRWFNEHEATKALMTSKRVTLNLGENGQFNFDVSKPEFVNSAITNLEVWQRITATKSGEPDVVKLQKLVLYAADPLKFENDLVNYGKSLALPGVVEEGRNIVPPNKVIPMSPENKGKPEGYKSSKVGG